MCVMGSCRLGAPDSVARHGALPAHAPALPAADPGHSLWRLRCISTNTGGQHFLEHAETWKALAEVASGVSA